MWSRSKWNPKTILFFHFWCNGPEQSSFTPVTELTNYYWDNVHTLFLPPNSTYQLVCSVFSFHFNFRIFPLDRQSGPSTSPGIWPPRQRVGHQMESIQRLLHRLLLRGLHGLYTHKVHFHKWLIFLRYERVAAERSFYCLAVHPSRLARSHSTHSSALTWQITNPPAKKHKVSQLRLSVYVRHLYSLLCRPLIVCAMAIFIGLEILWAGIVSLFTCVCKGWGSSLIIYLNFHSFKWSSGGHAPIFNSINLYLYYCCMKFFCMFCINTFWQKL